MFVRYSVVALLLLCVAAVIAESPLDSDKGVIRDANCAVAVGVAILRSVYSDEQVGKARFRAELEKGEWRVSEESPAPNSGEAKFGGGFYITLSQKDGRVLLIGFDE